MTFGIITKIRLVPESAAAPVLSGHYYAVTINSEMVDETLTDFPVCTQLNSTDHEVLFNELSALEGINAAKKIKIVDSDEETILNTEVDYCSIADGVIVLHTAMTLSSSEDKVYYIVFDASADDNDQMDIPGSVVGQSVWDDNFRGVYHCNEDPTPVADIIDSTQYGNNMITSGSMTSADLVADKPGQGYETDGANDSIYKATNLGISAYPFTMEAAAFANVVGGAYGAPTVAMADNSDTTRIFSLNVYDGNFRILVSNGFSDTGTTVINDGDFIHTAHINIANDNHDGYLNGALECEVNDSYAFPAGIDIASLNSIRDSSPGYRAGTIAEARFSDIERSAAWIKATYHTLNGNLSTMELIFDLTLFTLVDENSDLTFVADQASFDTMERDIITYAYYDFGAAILGDYIIEFESQAERGAGSPDDNGNVGLIALTASTLGTTQDILTANDGTNLFYYDNNNFSSYMDEYENDNGPGIYTDGGTSMGPYFFVFARINGDVFYAIFDDADHTNLIAVRRFIGSSTLYRYFLTCLSRENSTGGNSTLTGYMKDFKLIPPLEIYPYENLIEYTEGGTTNRIVYTPSVVYYRDLRQSDTTYLTKDFGSGYFGDFDIEWETQIIQATEQTSQVALCQLANVLGNFPEFDTANEGLIVDFFWQTNVTTWRIRDFNGDVQDTLTQGDAQALFHYWFKLTRIGTALTLYIHDDAARTSLVDTLTITCASTTFRYFSAMGSRASGVTDNLTGMNRNYKITVDSISLDLTLFTEVDAAGDITITEDKCDVVAMTTGVDSYVYKDFGADNFDDFIIEFDAEVTASDSNATAALFCVSDTVGGMNAWNAANDGINVYALNNSGSMEIRVIDRSNNDRDEYVIGGSITSHLYFTVTRSGTGVTVQIYSDSDRTTLLDTLTITGSSSDGKRYLYCLGSQDTGSGDLTFYTQNFKIIT